MSAQTLNFCSSEREIAHVPRCTYGSQGHEGDELLTHVVRVGTGLRATDAATLYLAGHQRHRNCWNNIHKQEKLRYTTKFEYLCRRMILRKLEDYVQLTLGEALAQEEEWGQR